MMTSLLAVVETELYIAQAAELLDEAERAAIVDAVAGAPMMGVLIKGTKGLRKMRSALQGRGKRGGGRLIYGSIRRDIRRSSRWFMPRIPPPI